MMSQIPALVGATGNLITGIAGATSDRGMQKRNKQQLEELLLKEKTGGLGLSGQEERGIENSTLLPAQKAAAEARSRAEQLMAAGGQASPGDLQKNAQIQAAQMAQGRQQAAQAINAANLQKQQQQKAEIEARLAQKAEMAQRDIDMVGKPATDLAVQGATAATQMMAPGLGGAPMAGFSPEQLEQLKSMLGGGGMG